MSRSVKNAVNLLLLSVAFGGGVMHSYVVTPIGFKYLSREEFGNFQNKLFPFYFLGQTAAPILIGLTTPLSTKAAFTALAASAIAGALNYFWVLPICKGIREARMKLQGEKRHEKIVDGAVEPSEEFKQLSKRFGAYHGISSILNLISLVTLGVYGVGLARII